jgi:hypothetical protein
VAVCCEYGGKSSDAGTTELVSWLVRDKLICNILMNLYSPHFMKKPLRGMGG